MTDILEKLQKMSDSPHDYDIGYWWNAVDEAIDEVERLRELVQLLNRSRPDAELARLRTLVYAYPPSEPYAPDGVTWQQEAERLRQENEVFKEQLTHWVAEDHKQRGLLREWLIEENNAEGGSDEHAQWYFGFLTRVRKALGE